MAHPTFHRLGDHAKPTVSATAGLNGSHHSLFDDDDDQTKPKVSHWQSLRNRLEAGTLMQALREIGGTQGKAGKSSKYTGGGAINAKLIILQAKSQHDAEKARLKLRHEKRMMIKKRKKLEQQLMDQAFPTMLGFYFDGFFTSKFKLNKEYAGIFNALEEEISKKKEAAYKETFIEKTKRNFWPPRVIGGLMFRTRGVYLDFKEILKDPPHTPPDIIIDPRLITNDKEVDKLQQKLEEIEQIEAMKAGTDAKEKVPRTGPRVPNDFYFTKGKYHIRDLEKIYYKDKKTGIWKVDPNEDIYAGDLVPESYYFDKEEGNYKFKSDKKPAKKETVSLKDKLGKTKSKKLNTKQSRKSTVPANSPGPKKESKIPDELDGSTQKQSLRNSEAGAIAPAPVVESKEPEDATASADNAQNPSQNTEDATDKDKP